jgi:hypothetical protein
MIENTNSIKLLQRLGLEFMETQTKDEQQLSVYSINIKL